MLSKIREKSQGTFAWVILVLICVPFALWGIQNYAGSGSESTIVSVGDRDFYQQDLNEAYSQYSQTLSGTNFDETAIKQQALEKLIRDEVLFQHVQEEGLVATDEMAKRFIKSLTYFQTEGVFDNTKYKALLAAQRMSPKEFVARVKKALIMEQFQRSLTESSFVTQKELDNFFKIQNQTRHVEIISIPLKAVEQQPSAEAIENYYQQQQNSYVTEELVSIEYIDLSLDKLAEKVQLSDEELQTYYEEQKDLYSTKERRKISHILFSFTNDSGEDKKQLEKALKTKLDLQNQDFAVLAAERSDDKLTAEKGGDLGLFNQGVMEKAFEEAVNSLELNQVSEPVKSAFGYHLIKVTELVASQTKPFEAVKDELTTEYQRAKAENSFYELGEVLTEVSYENPDSLQAVADSLGIEIQNSELFSRKNRSKDLITSQAAIIKAAFSEEVLKGNNSEPIELGSDRLVVLRVLEHKPVETKALADVKPLIVAKLLHDKAIEIAKKQAEEIKKSVLAGQLIQDVAEQHALKVDSFSKLTRANGDLSWQVNQAIFKAAKPVAGKSTVVTVTAPSGDQTVINLLSVTEGVMSESDKAKQKLAVANMAKAFGEADLDATLTSLRENADIITQIVE